MATEGSSNATTCTFSVSVVDTAVPYSITCRAQTDADGAAANNVQAVSSNGTAAVHWSATAATDLGYAANTLTISYASGGAVATGDPFALGNHTITSTATDGSSNSTTCTFSVSVVDTAVPHSITCGAKTDANGTAANTV